MDPCKMNNISKIIRDLIRNICCNHKHLPNYNMKYNTMNGHYIFFLGNIAAVPIRFRHLPQSSGEIQKYSEALLHFTVETDIYYHLKRQSLFRLN